MALDIPAELRRVKERDGLSEEGLGELLAISQATVNRWLSGQIPSARQYPVIARVIGRTVDEVREGYAVGGVVAHPKTGLEQLDERVRHLEETIEERFETLEKGLAAIHEAVAPPKPQPQKRRRAAAS